MRRKRQKTFLRQLETKSTPASSKRSNRQVEIAFSIPSKKAITPEKETPLREYQSGATQTHKIRGV